MTASPVPARNAGANSKTSPSSVLSVDMAVLSLRQALDSLHAMRRAGQFTDVTLVAGDREVHAHKNVLAACSPYFYAMFTGFDESRRDRVVLGNIDPAALETLVEYVYTAKVGEN